MLKKLTETINEIDFNYSNIIFLYMAVALANLSRFLAFFILLFVNKCCI